MPIDLIFEVILNYFADVHRIKEFHSLEKINSIKISSYEAYWLMKIKPIQIINFETDIKEKLILINEYYTTNTLLSHIFDKKLIISQDIEKLSQWRIFYDYLIYNFHHRIFTAQTLELTLLALFTDPMYA